MDEFDIDAKIENTTPELVVVNLQCQDSQTGLSVSAGEFLPGPYSARDHGLLVARARQLLADRLERLARQLRHG